MKKIIHHIRHIRKQPESVRRHVAHVTIFICGIILGLLWIYSLGARIADPETQAKATTDIAGPLSSLKDNLVGGYQSISQ